MMKKYFTHYWNNDTFEYHKKTLSPSAALGHTAGNLFKARGVSSDDVIYVVTVKRGVLYLLYKMIVQTICDQARAKEILRNNELWEAGDHIIASEASLCKFDVSVSLEDVKRLKFNSSNGIVGLKFKNAAQLDQQTLRGVRQLTSASSLILDKYCGKLRTIS